MLKEQIKVIPGMPLYLCQEGRTSGCMADVKQAYFVDSISDKEIVIKEAQYVWDDGSKDQPHFDSMPIKIMPNPNGHKIVLHWSNTISGGCWWAYKESVGRDYPKVAHFGKAIFFPYVD